MLSKVKNSLVHVLSQDPLSDYKLCDRKYRGGKNNLLRIQDALETSTGKPVSIVSVDVKEIVTRCSTAAEVQYTLNAFKNGVSLLTRLRHPGILQVVRPIVEDKKHLRFVTERISSLLPLELSNGTLSKQEKLLELFKLAKVIQFIHERAGYLLCDFSPEAVCIVDGEWKVFDLSHAVAGTEAARLSWPHPLSSVAAPLLDYCSNELVRAIKPQEDGPIDLFVSNTHDTIVKLPESDVFSFVLVCVEVLSGRKAFNCGGNAELHSRQYNSVEAEVSRWFSGCPLKMPRPSLASIRMDRMFTTEDIQVLTSLEDYDTLDENSRFGTLKKLYDGLGQSAFQEAMILRLIIPLMRRESLQEVRLRYALPIMLQCCRCVSQKAFDTSMRDYFTALFRAVSTADTFERCGIVAELILEKFDLLEKYFANISDRNNVIVPFLGRCVDPTIGKSKITQLAVERIAQLAENAEDLQFPDSLPERLIDLILSDPQNATPVFVCLERVVRYVSLAARELTEARLIRYACTFSFETGNANGTLGRSLSLLERLYESFSRDHKATQSIPLLAPLLLSTSVEVSLFGRRMIEKMVVEVTVLSSADVIVDDRPYISSSVDRRPAVPFEAELTFFDDGASHPIFF
ncbi:hypothetical protein DQ04_01001060 [Trypanosoma grayi]|uniref:hypothetical protein n=1 Tax=Trypanosoma grayi TaxID=71804 RepID=UPI0004F46200|nr:hypothetical protein DQ04_01001060 [Trypanosoma grayi]KEG13443.1 hypothetical protein DQ04_01001060 [Trypanosoma grayi]